MFTFKMRRLLLTGVSAVRSRSAFVLNLPVQGLGCSFWSDPAAAGFRRTRETLGVSVGKRIMGKVSLKNFNKISNHDLIRLFKYVNDRNHSLIDEIELKEFKDKTNTWCFNSNSEFFGIFNNNDFVGTISLSKQNMKEKRACIGYEIFPSFRKQGFASIAFKLTNLSDT